MTKKVLKQSFLLSRSVLVRDGSSIGQYDPNKEINITIIDEKQIPTVLCSNNQKTQSKTFAAPGDDDPDYEAESCY